MKTVQGSRKQHRLHTVPKGRSKQQALTTAHRQAQEPCARAGSTSWDGWVGCLAARLALTSLGSLWAVEGRSLSAQSTAMGSRLLPSPGVIPRGSPVRGQGLWQAVGHDGRGQPADDP